MESIFQGHQVHKITHNFQLDSKNEENGPCGIPYKHSEDPYCILELMYMPTYLKRKLIMLMFKALNSMKEDDFTRSLVSLINLEELGFKSDKYGDGTNLNKKLEQEELSFVDMTHEQHLQMLKEIEVDKIK